MNAIKISLILSSIFFLNLSPAPAKPKTKKLFRKVKKTVQSKKAKDYFFVAGALTITSLSLGFVLKKCLEYQKYWNSLTPTQKAEKMSGNHHYSRYIKFDTPSDGTFYVENNLDNPLRTQNIFYKNENEEHEMRCIPTNLQNRISCLTCKFECKAVQEFENVDYAGVFNFLAEQRNHEEQKRELARLERLANQPVITTQTIIEEIIEK